VIAHFQCRMEKICPIIFPRRRVFNNVTVGQTLRHNQDENLPIRTLPILNRPNSRAQWSNLTEAGRPSNRMRRMRSSTIFGSVIVQPAMVTDCATSIADTCTAILPPDDIDHIRAVPSGFNIASARPATTRPVKVWARLAGMRFVTAARARVRDRLGRLLEVERIITIKDHAKQSPPDHVPPNIAAAFNEAATCMSVE
jgi:hypothetical protein